MNEILFIITIVLFIVTLLSGAISFIYFRAKFTSEKYRILNKKGNKANYFILPDIKKDNNKNEVDNMEKLRLYSIYFLVITFVILFILSLILIIFFPEYNEIKT